MLRGGQRGMLNGEHSPRIQRFWRLIETQSMKNVPHLSIGFGTIDAPNEEYSPSAILLLAPIASTYVERVLHPTFHFVSLQTPCNFCSPSLSLHGF
jgi:hypothetical protein